MSMPAGLDLVAYAAAQRARLHGHSAHSDLRDAVARPYGGTPHPYVVAALRGVCEHLASMSEESGRNSYLNAQVWRFVGYACAGHIAEADVLADLRDAALRAGLGDFEVRKVLRADTSGAVANGRSCPLDPPPRAEVAAAQAGGVEVDLAWNPDTGELLDDVAVARPDLDPEVLRAEVEAHREHLVRERLPVLDWHKLWNETVEVEWLLEPLVPARRLIALYSPPKVGKSLLMLEIAAALAAGRTVLGAVDLPARRVLYVDFENDPHGDVLERLQAMGYTPGELDGLRYLSFPTLDMLDTASGGAMLLAAAQVHEVDLVVIDTVSRAVGGDENSNDTWLNFYRNTGMRLKRAGIACLRLDHSGKDAEKGMRGGSAKYGDVDAVWRLSTVVDEKTYALECTDNRFPLVEKTLTLHRERLPWLHHRVDPAGRRAAFAAECDEAVAVLDGLGLPDNAGERRTTAALTEAGVHLKRLALRDALKVRQERHERRSALVWHPPPVLDGQGFVEPSEGSK